MSHPVPLVRFRDLEPGQFADFFALLAERKRGTTRDGKPFYTCRFRDAARAATFQVWADGGWFDPCERDWREGKFYRLRGTYGHHERYGPQIDLEAIREVTDADRAEGFNPADFAAGPRRDGRPLLAELQALTRAHIADEPLRRLVLGVLDRHAEPLMRLPATRRHFYPFPGGLLEHILSVTRNCLLLTDKYADLRPPLNKDLVIAGAILHDIGRVAEWEESALSTHKTVPGELFGHLILGRDLVRDAAREQGDVDPDLLALLEHLIITHLALPEWGSPRLPVIPECLVVHHADDLDAKLEMYTRCLSQDTEPGPFTARDPVLNRALWKGRPP